MRSQARVAGMLVAGASVGLFCLLFSQNRALTGVWGEGHWGWEGGRQEMQGQRADGARKTPCACRALIGIVVVNESQASRRGLDGSSLHLTGA